MGIEAVGLVGLGWMGRGIAACLAAHGLEVRGVDVDSERREAAQSHVAATLSQMRAQGLLSSEDYAEALGKFRTTAEMAPLASCDFAIESVSEDFQVKQHVLRDLEKVLHPGTPIATNTSAIPITELQSGCRFPQRVIGMHWAEPCHLTRFLEIIRGAHTDDATTELTVQLGRQAGKDPCIVQRDVDGFIVNRLAYALYREAFWLLENEVADVETIDRAFVNAISVWANVAGPFRWMDITGLPAYAAAMERLFPKLSTQTDLPETMRRLMESGAQGVSNGRGFYDYGPDDAEHWKQVLSDNVLFGQPSTGTSSSTKARQ